ncbi:iron chelate uptake ABC transporter family permease subunit [Bergeyella cardium]|uniref:Iron chelate uptake ABC transporter family permease subunit n=1 Tax=Bergeyella cardium TaxID=1585976 RepID=A0A6P1QVE9_9FLAO|nr:iron chelate uptake ABC transporter family permease subunit [Bergeyella cardium]QHN65986.1 iron chelate uptake ABC transporter family permease subunit [Bergeyella cardium]WHE33591.1 iron chelate uptake ABC transporter family permease subunit [Bergeyella cardium]WHF60241.1 iron chelate uptake ABC transporter family permease subunit [Bergeyella cardium]
MGRGFTKFYGVLVALAFFAAFLNLNTGFISLSTSDFLYTNSPNYDIAVLRFHRVIAVLIAGVSIPTAGFVLQEYFRNPLAGAEVLGISAVASLAVALYIFLSKDLLFPEFLQNNLLNLSAIVGSVLMLLILLAFSRRIADKSFLIIFGFLVSALAGAVISLLQFYADSQSLRNYILWSFGANNQLSGSQIFILGGTTLVGLALCIRVIKPLMGISLGENYALSLGVNLHRLKFLAIITTSLLSASVTAFMGSILFIGIVIPHFSRLLYNPSRLWHQWLLNMALGVLIMEVFSALSEVLSLSLNIISSIFGIPVILMMLIKGKR